MIAYARAILHAKIVQAVKVCHVYSSIVPPRADTGTLKIAEYHQPVIITESAADAFTDVAILTDARLKFDIDYRTISRPKHFPMAIPPRSQSPHKQRATHAMVTAHAADIMTYAKKVAEMPSPSDARRDKAGHLLTAYNY